MSVQARSRSHLAPALMAAWFLAALVVGALGGLAALPVPGPQLVLFSLLAATLVVGLRVAPVREWIESLPVRALVGIHLVRFVGIAFLLLAARGELSPLFAERAGWGDIVAAVGALALLPSGEPRSRAHRWAYLAWNTFGLLDLVVVVATATWVATRGLEPGMAPLLRLPLSLLPTFIVPILMASHVFLFRRLAGSTHGR